MSLRTSYRPEDEAVAVRWMSERTQAASAAGLDGLYVGDHHATGPGPYFQNVPILARLADEWRSEGPIGALFLLPLWHPVTLAEQVGTLAALTSNRFVLLTAVGGGASQFRAMGVAESDRARRFEVGLDLTLQLLAGERVSDETGIFGIDGAQIAPRPARRVEVWIGASARVGIDRAARLGDGWLANAPLVATEARDQAAHYLARCNDLGRRPSVVAIRRDVHVADDDRTARAELDRAVSAGYRGFRQEALIAGDVQQVTAQFEEYRAMGYDEIVVRHFSEDQPAVLRSIELLGHVRAALSS